MTGGVQTGESPPEAQPAVDRVIGRIRGRQGGPTLLCVGGLHGNEPAGVQALRRVLARLEPRTGVMCGDFVALTGNRRALALGRRFVDRDLNRAWNEEGLGRLRHVSGPGDSAEDLEQVELLRTIEGILEEARGPVYFMDLHTTSGFGGPFTTFGDTLANRDLAAHIPVPMILGLEELVDGTLLAFLGSHGIVGVAYESGQHDEPRAVQRAEAAIWLTVAAVGLLEQTRLPEATEGWKLLSKDTRHLPRAMEMTYRHDVGPLDGFAMEPGYQNFQRVRAGQVVANDIHGPIRVEHEARILMPLYQKQGDDGYFLIREFSPFWLRASYILRSLRVDRWIHWLPGVSLDEDAPDSVVVNKRVARWGAQQLLHLLGFRRKEDAGSRLVMRRRRFDEARYVVRGPRPEVLLRSR